MAELNTRTAPETRREPIMRDGRELTARNDIRFLPATYNPDTREIDVSLGTGADVERYDWNTGKWFIERLSMAPQSIRLERMNGGAPFLEDHNQYDISATRGVFIPGMSRIEGGELKGRVKLSRSKRAEDTVLDIIDGISRNTSVGYIVHSSVTSVENGTEIRTAIDWEPIEGSIVGIPADITGGVRSADTAPANMEGTMAEPTVDPVVEPETVPAAEPAPVADPAPVAEPQRALDVEKEKAAAAERAVAEYEARCQDIRKTGRSFGLTETDIDAVVANRGLTAAEAVRALQELRAERDKMDGTNGRIEIGTEESTKRAKLMENELMSRAGAKVEINHDAKREFGNLSLVEMCRNSLGAEGRTMSRHELFKRMTSSDFPLLLANVANKIALDAQAMLPDYRWFERVFTRMDYNDFRPHATPWLGKSAIFPSVVEGDNYTLGSMTERNETSTAVKYGRDFDFTFEMFINDDLSAFTGAAAEIAEASLRTASSLCGALLTGNQVMGDGVVLFHTATHANLSTSGGAATVARLNELWKMLLEQTMLDDKGATVRIGQRGNYLLMPVSAQPTVEQLYWPGRQLNDFTTEALVAGIPAENRLVVPSFTGVPYYMATGARNSARFGYLREDGGLVIERYDEVKADKIVYHARMVFGCHINRWQDFASNPGA